MFVLILHITRKVLFEKHSIKHEMEYFLISFLDGCEIKLSESYPDNIFYIKNNIILFQKKTISKLFYVRHDLIWSIFECKYKMERPQIQEFIKISLETHLKLDGYTPFFVDSFVEYI